MAETGYDPQYDNELTSWGFMGCAVVVYLISIKVLQIFVQGQTPYKLEFFTKLYNLSQILLCGYMTWGFYVHGFSLVNPMGLNSKFTHKIEYFMYVHYLSKYLDFFDTWIMILKQNFRQLSFLHVFHHSSILMVWGYLLQVGQGNGTAYYGAFLNSIIHFIMYSHYLWTSFGYKNPFKKMVTYSQLIQFFMCIIHSISAVLYEEVLKKELAYLQFCYHVIMIALFSDFFIKTYRGEGKEGKEGKESNGKEANGANGANGKSTKKSSKAD